MGWWKFEEEWFPPFKPFNLELKRTIYKYWILIKIKISMTYVYKEYKSKMEIKIFLAYNIKVVI